MLLGIVATRWSYIFLMITMDLVILRNKEHGQILTGYVPNWDTDDFQWDLVSSGNTDLTPFIAPSVAIAFKYTGTNSDGATWEVDNIIIRE